MTHEQSALHIWSVLVLAARTQQVLSYGTMEGITGHPAHLQAPILGRIEDYCKAKKFPKITSILVNQEDGVPGYLYPGYEGADGKLDPQVYLNLFREQSLVFIFDWLKHGAPSETDFAARTAPPG
jgi:hypothetical protein